VLVLDAGRGRRPMMARRRRHPAFERAFTTRNNLGLLRRLTGEAVEWIGRNVQQTSTANPCADKRLQLGHARALRWIEVFDQRVVARVHVRVDVDDPEAISHRRLSSVRTCTPQALVQRSPPAETGENLSALRYEQYQ